jgi:hypothetical protein
MPRPVVTVLIDTYNHERFIEQAINSVLEQDFPLSDAEIIVVDDGSTDRTPELVRRFEPRVRLLQKKNGGQASAFNAGMPEARGEIVAFLDGDDWWAPNKLSSVVEAMRRDPSLGIVGHGITMVHLDGREQSEILREGFRFQANTVEGARLFRLRKSFLGTSRMALRADLLRRIGSVPEALTLQADEYLFTLGAVLAPGEVLKDALTYYRIHDANGFQLSANKPQQVRRKSGALAAVASSLSEQLVHLGVDPRTRDAITEIIQAEADQLRLMLDGGWSWETAKTEWNIYTVMGVDAPFSHRVFKILSLLPALALPPRLFYGLRQKLAQSNLYLWARHRVVPMAEPGHVRRSSKASQ